MSNWATSDTTLQFPNFGTHFADAPGGVFFGIGGGGAEIYSASLTITENVCTFVAQLDVPQT